MRAQTAAPPICVVGSLNLDVVVGVEGHPRPGETVIGGDLFRNPGGKGANQAVAAARLGGRVAMVGRVGDDDAGSLLLESLHSESVDVGAVRVVKGGQTGVALIAVDDAGENTIVVSPGTNAQVGGEDVDAALSVIRDARLLLLQLETPLNAVEAAARATTGTVMLNPAPPQALPRSLLRLVDVLVPNEGELVALTGGNPTKELEELTALARLLAGPHAIVVTLGRRGALMVTEKDALHVPAPAVESIDTTAAGDCFCGALAVALGEGANLGDAVRWAVRAASISTSRRGAQASLPRRFEVEDTR